MCQMCDEYENELARIGLIEDAKKFREEREREHAKAVTEARDQPFIKRVVGRGPGSLPVDAA